VDPTTPRKHDVELHRFEALHSAVNHTIPP
jgi:hypothetical protein